MEYQSDLKRRDLFSVFKSDTCMSGSISLMWFVVSEFSCAEKRMGVIKAVASKPI